MEREILKKAVALYASRLKIFLGGRHMEWAFGMILVARCVFGWMLSA
jgi:hypothetical protein